MSDRLAEFTAWANSLTHATEAHSHSCYQHRGSSCLPSFSNSRDHSFTSPLLQCSPLPVHPSRRAPATLYLLRISAGIGLSERQRGRGAEVAPG